MQTATAQIVISNRTAEDAAEDLMAAKKLHKETEKLVLEAEEELIKLLGEPGEKSKTHNINGFKIELKGKVNRKVDWDILDAVCAELAQQEPFFNAPIKLKRELDETEVKRLFKDQPGIYARIAKSLTATPGKTGVTVVRTE